MRICIRISLLKHLCKNTQLTLSDQITIEVGLREQKSFSAITTELGKDSTTIFKEARAYIKLKQAGGYNPCIVRKEYKHYGDMCTSCKFAYAAEPSIAIPSILTRRAAVKSPTNLLGAFFQKVHPLTICSRAISCSLYATLTPIRERS